MVTRKEVASFYEDLIGSWEQSLNGPLSVEYDPSFKNSWHAKRSKGGVKLTVSFSPMHNEFPEILRRATTACLELRFNRTHATEIIGKC